MSAPTFARRRRASQTSTTPAPPATEIDFYATVLDTCRITGWRVAHFRPALTRHGWRTPVQGDGAGFPDFVLVHPHRRQVWWVELKRGRAPLTPEQKAWAADLEAAGAVYRLVRVPWDINRFLQDLADVNTERRS